MRLVTLVRGITITFLSLCPISVGHGQSPAEFYKRKNANIYILSLCQASRTTPSSACFPDPRHQLGKPMTSRLSGS
jgi:hypothetical protein